MRQIMYASALLFSFGTICIVAQSALSADPILGTWELNVVKSKFAPGRAPKRETRTYVVAGNDINASTAGIDASGKPTASSWTINYDGKDRAFAGTTDIDALSFRRIDARHYEYTQKKAGKVVSTGTRTFSVDGNVMTLTTKGTDPQGKSFEQIAVFEKR